MSEQVAERTVAEQVPWVLDHVVDTGDRMLLVYEIPPGPLTANGVYGVAMPKDMANDWAAVYGYDLDTDEGVEQAVDHMLYFGYLETVLTLTGENPAVSPLAYSQAAAKGRVQDKIAELKQKWEIKEKRPDAEVRSVRAEVSPKVLQGASIRDVLREQIKARVDKQKIAERRSYAATQRQSIQRRGMAMRDAKYDGTP